MIFFNINEFLVEISIKQENILAIDLGHRKTGLAISDPKKKYSIPMRVLNYNKKDLFNKLLKNIEDYNIGSIVIGIPLNFDGSENKKTQSIKDISKNFNTFLENNNFKIPIFFWDERYSSLEATEKLKNLCIKTIKQKKIIDKFAASEILQDFLNFKNKKKND
tara:strand:+ start:49884 stop:50372 length:489 start_codon:yes stop_codon:yes gene_type:complete